MIQSIAAKCIQGFLLIEISRQRLWPRLFLPVLSEKLCQLSAAGLCGRAADLERTNSTAGVASFKTSRKIIAAQVCMDEAGSKAIACSGGIHGLYRETRCQRDFSVPNRHCTTRAKLDRDAGRLCAKRCEGLMHVALPAQLQRLRFVQK